MRKFLSVILSVSLIITPLNLTCSAATKWKNEESECYDVSSNKERFVIKGKSMPTIVINNNCEAKADSKSEAESKSNSKASAGNSKAIELLKIILKVVGAYIALKCAHSAISKGKDLLLDGKDKIIDSLKSIFNNVLEQIKANQQIKVDEAEKEGIWQQLKTQAGDMVSWVAKIAPTLHTHFTLKKGTNNLRNVDNMNAFSQATTFSTTAA